MLPAFEHINRDLRLEIGCKPLNRYRMCQAKPRKSRNPSCHSPLMSLVEVGDRLEVGQVYNIKIYIGNELSCLCFEHRYTGKLKHPLTNPNSKQKH